MRYGATSIPPKVAKKEATSDPHDEKDPDHQKLLEEATRRVMNLSSEIRGLTKSSVELMAQKAHQIRTLESCEKQCQDLAIKVQAMEGLRSQQAKAKKQTKTKTKNKAKSKRGMGEVLSRAANAILRNEPSPAEQRNGDGDGAKGLPPLPPIHLPKKEPQNCRVIPYPMVAAALMILHSISSSKHRRIISDMELASKNDKDQHHREYQNLRKEAIRRINDLKGEIRCLQQKNGVLMEQKAHLIRTLESCEKENEALSCKVQSMESLRAKETEANSCSYDDAVGATTLQLRAAHGALEATVASFSRDLFKHYC